MTIDVVQRPEILNADITCSANCEEGSEEGLIVNLHPDFPIPEDQLHVDRAFPWLQHVVAVGQRQDAMGLRGPHPSSLEELRKWHSSVQTHPERWAIVSKAWSLERSGRRDLSQSELTKYRMPSTRSSLQLRDVIFDFCGRLLQSQASLYTDAFAEFQECAQRDPQQFAFLRRYYLEHWANDHRERVFDILSEYFRDFGEFSQALLLRQYELPIGGDEVASSQSFSRTKMFYGNSFEALTSHFVVLACVNNIRAGRAFDRFQNMDLQKYLTINKARRSEPFASTPAFAAFAARLNSGLRNASHHGAVKLDRTSTRISYRSGGTGAEHTMRYIEYLVLCSENVLRLCALFMLELALAKE